MSERTLRQLVGALAVAVLLWIVATLLSRGGGSVEASGAIVDFFDGLDSTATITSARLISSSDTLELVPRGGRWTVDGYPTDSATVARFFKNLDDVKVDDVAATNPANHARMGVSEDSAHVLELQVGGETRRLLVGDEGSRFQTFFARLPGQDDVYLLDGNLRSDVTRQLDAWRNKRMVAIDTSAVARVDVDRDGDRYTLMRQDSSWVFEGGGDTNPAAVRDVLTELHGMLASGFLQPADSLYNLRPGGSLVAYSQSGDTLATVTVSEGNNERWGRVPGDAVTYRLPRFRVDRVTPTREHVAPTP